MTQSRLFDDASELVKHTGWAPLAALGSGITLDKAKRAGAAAGVKWELLHEALEWGESAGHLKLDSKNERILWSPLALHEAMAEVIKNPLAIKTAALDRSLWTHDTQSYTNTMRWFVYLNRVSNFFNLLSYSSYQHAGWIEYFLPAEPGWITTRETQIQEAIFKHLLPELFNRGELSPSLAEFFKKTPVWPAQSMEVALLQNDLETAESLLKRVKTLQGQGYQDMLTLLQGQVEEAYRGFQKRIERRKPQVPVFSSLPALFARLAALRIGDLEGSRDGRYGSESYSDLDRLLVLVARTLQDPDMANPLEDITIFERPKPGLELCMVSAIETAFPASWVPDRKEARAAARVRLENSGLTGMLLQLDEVSASQRPPTHWGAGLYRQEAWEFFLANLRARGLENATAAAKKTADQRLVWLLNDPNHVEVIKQKLGKNGWLTGASIAWKTLLESPPDFLIEQDRVILGKLQRVNRYGYTELVFGGAAVKAMIGHPNLSYRGEPCELVDMPLELNLDEKGGDLFLTLQPPIPKGQEWTFLPRADGRLGVVAPDAQQLKLREVLPATEVIPAEARERLLQSLDPWLDRVQLTYATETEPLVPSKAGDSRLVVQLRPYKQGLRLSLRVRPLGDEGPLFLPGAGPAQESLRWNSQVFLIQRDLNQELALRREVLIACPAMYDSDDQEFPEAEEALELLLELQAAEVPLEWPENQPWKVKPPVASGQLRLQADSSSGWFELQGELMIDDGLKVELSRMLELSRTSQGRFVSLGEGQFIALTEDLKQKLVAIDELVEQHKKSLRLSPLAIPTLAELDTALQGDEAFVATLERFRSAESYVPQLPRGLQAELRDYQLEGFRWMAQRARAGAGICLADDMGLGKTVQTISLLLKESKEGPSLVLCPTSVTSNWFDQINRFAPDLRPLYHEGKNRTAQLAELGPGDVLLCSYRILLQDRVELKEVGWNLVVLDEAQYIKNPESKTARAAFEINARTRLATTGTPIENRLSELWSIFRFLNPGLLGTLPSFRRRFEAPVLAGQSGPRQRLRRLVGPFILRRTKSQVLTELPPRTEISLAIELSAPERAIYEDVRHKAEKGLKADTGQFEMLAQLTRLRQACCHPQLLLPEQTLSSSKFEAFFELAEELLAGRHRTLVFSQFVELLKLLEAQLQARGMSYLYLDGSTPVATRRERVDAFQGGEGDFFLISLKAGGTGLNLTGADYVVHLDPWWNPAAEDQASDRAHRIGQQRPVTIYRLIAKDTIEEKVVDLHGVKRELAQGVLDGADGNNQLTTRELMDLLRG